jgi:hypothetical protein
MSNEVLRFLPAPTLRVLWEFVRLRDKKTFRCEVGFHRHPAGWKLLFFDGETILATHTAFTSRELAEHWADEIRKRFLRDAARAGSVK